MKPYNFKQQFIIKLYVQVHNYNIQIQDINYFNRYTSLFS